MTKDIVFTIRMDPRTRDLMKKAAVKEHRSMASLIDKIMYDYMIKEGFIDGPDLPRERRREPREPVVLPVKTLWKSGKKKAAYSGVALNLSKGGALVTYPKDSEARFSSTGGLPGFELCLKTPKSGKEVCINCETRHMTDTGSEIKLGVAFVEPDAKGMLLLSRYLN